MKKWLIFSGGVLTGIVLTILFAYITVKRSEGDNGITWFERPGDIIDAEAFEVFQVLAENAALVHGKSDEYSSIEIFTGAVYLLINEDGKYYYDDEIVRVPNGKKARQVGIYQYPTQSDFMKTVPIIQIMETASGISVETKERATDINIPSTGNNYTKPTKIMNPDEIVSPETPIGTTAMQMKRMIPEPVNGTELEDEPYRELSTIEILEKRNHADVVRRAERAGVSTEGSTMEILERINHADVVRRAERAGVSTEGSTMDILERINHADVVKRAERAGVSTEGSTMDILERINRKELEK